MRITGIPFMEQPSRSTPCFTRRRNEVVNIGSGGEVSFKFLGRDLTGKARIEITLPDTASTFVRDIESRKELPGEVEQSENRVIATVGVGKTEIVIIDDRKREFYIRTSNINLNKLRVYVNSPIEVPVHRNEIFEAINSEVNPTLLATQIERLKYQTMTDEMYVFRDEDDYAPQYARVMSLWE